jgi:hypothetical protein
MKTLTFIGISGKISTKNYKSIVINKYSIQSYPPSIYFGINGGNELPETIELFKMYSVVDYDYIYFKSHAECTLTYELL